MASRCTLATTWVHRHRRLRLPASTRGPPHAAGPLARATRRRARAPPARLSRVDRAAPPRDAHAHLPRRWCWSGRRRGARRDRDGEHVRGARRAAPSTSTRCAPARARSRQRAVGQPPSTPAGGSAGPCPSSRTTAAVACSRAGPTPTGPPANATETSSPKSCAWPHHQRSGKPPPQFFSAYAPAPSRLNDALPADHAARARRRRTGAGASTGSARARRARRRARRTRAAARRPAPTSAASTRQSGPRSSRTWSGPAGERGAGAHAVAGRIGARVLQRRPAEEAARDAPPARRTPSARRRARGSRRTSRSRRGRSRPA